MMDTWRDERLGVVSEGLGVAHHGPASVLPSKEDDKGGRRAGRLLPCLPSPQARFPRTAFLQSARCWLLRHSVQLEQFG